MRIAVRTFFFDIDFICQMQNLSEAICAYISIHWIGKTKASLRSFATEHDIDEKTARQIKNAAKTPYKIGLYTLAKICNSRGISLETFFKLIKK